MRDIGEFYSWHNEYNKTFDSGNNVSQSFSNWFDNRRYINDHNSKNLGFTLKLNEFADMKKEWGNHNWSNQAFKHNPVKEPSEQEPVYGLPESVDWREKDLVTGVKNQQQCGSCWAFSAVGSMEGQHSKKSKHLVSLSESQIVDCDVNGTDQGCGGGLMDGAFEYVIKQGGLESENSYPYKPEDEPCRFNRSEISAQFSSFKDVEGGENGLQEAVASVGPISVAIDASQQSFQLYDKGVYYDEDCSSTMLDHGVLVVGYGRENGSDYWLVKNSWGVNWGENGYIKMARNRSNNCGIATNPSYPVV